MTSTVLEAHRQGRHRELQSLGRELGDWLSEGERNMPRLFSRLVLLFHPDRLRFLDAKIREASDRADAAALNRLLRLFHAFDLVFGEERARGQDCPVDAEPWMGGVDEEAYAYDEADFDDIRSARESWFGDSGSGAEEDEGNAGIAADEDNMIPPGRAARRTLFDAIYAREYGHVPTDFAPRHLETFEGEMNLSDYEITDLHGAEWLTGIRLLQLSENHIRGLAALRSLERLEELYLARNQIEELDGLERLAALRILDLEGNDVSDLSPLFDLPAVEFVNVIGNPVPIAHVQRLRDRGVVVLVSATRRPGEEQRVLPF